MADDGRPPSWGLAPWERAHGRPTLGGRSLTGPTRKGVCRRSGFGGSTKVLVAVCGIAGAGLLGLSFSRKPGSGEFYVLT